MINKIKKYEKIFKFLTQSCNFPIGKFIYLKNINSTNDYALKYASSMPNMSIIIAENQSSGKGRNGRKWISVDSSCLTFSILFKQTVNLSKISCYKKIIPSYLIKDKTVYWLSLIAAISLVYVLRKYYGIISYIKWPNDIIVLNKKIAGILIEKKRIFSRDISKKLIQNYYVIGIGVNIYSIKNISNLAHAISISDILKKSKISKRFFFLNFMIYFMKCYKNFFINNFNIYAPVKHISKEYDIYCHNKNSYYSIINYLMITIGNFVAISTKDKKKFYGYALRLNKNGFLELENYKGNHIIIASGDVQHCFHENF